MKALYLDHTLPRLKNELSRPQRLLLVKKVTKSNYKTLIKKVLQLGWKLKRSLVIQLISEKDNIKYTKKNEIKLVAKLNPSVIQGNRKKEDEGMYVCKAGHLEIRKDR